jgi:hypothetical protein
MEPEGFITVKSTIFWDVTPCGESLQTFRRNLLPASSESKNKQQSVVFVGFEPLTTVTMKI